VPFRVRRAIAHGSGRIPKKALEWAHVLYTQGCTHLMVVHDQDHHPLADLTARLTQAIAGSPIGPRVVVIPVRAIEAWLLADHAAVSRALNLRPPLPKQANPQGILRPKAHLGALIEQRSRGRRRYLNTAHNKQIAEQAHPVQLRRCESFHGFEAFVRAQLA